MKLHPALLGDSNWHKGLSQGQKLQVEHRELLCPKDNGGKWAAPPAWCPSCCAICTLRCTEPHVLQEIQQGPCTVPFAPRN